MKNYSITTDSGAITVSASSKKEALKKLQANNPSMTIKLSDVYIRK